MASRDFLGSFDFEREATVAPAATGDFANGALVVDHGVEWL